MRSTLAASAGTCLLASVALTAADFWEEKDFTIWSTQQVEKMLSDSPWAKKVTIVVGRLREGSVDGFQGGGAGLGGGGGAQRGGGDDSAEFQQIRRVTVTIAWISALPIRQALVRRQTGPDATISPDLKQLSDDEPFYTVAVAGLPLQIVTRVGTIDQVKAATVLKPDRKEPIASANIRVSKDGEQSVLVEFLFPKTNAIDLGDKAVEFTTKLGDVELKKTFKLADMMVRGRLML